MPKDKAYLVICEIQHKSRNFLRDNLEEMKLLAESAGGTVVGHTLARVPHPSPSHFIREGKIQEIRNQVKESGMNVLLFNLDLTPVQARNIEASTGIRAVDRTGLILDIFARRAISHEGKLQVELAQLNYLLPRLVGQGVIMSRLGGGIGTRGPGEQKLEVDRRKIRQRIQKVKADLEKLERHRGLLRAGRKKKNLKQVALVGYTNAGKSTLLNALTGASAYVENKLFATLDPMTRIHAFAENGSQILFTDTVGFIRDLPHSLIKAFHATLEEMSEADVLLHVLDISASNFAEEKKVVEEVLEEIGIYSKKTLLVLNKSDRLTEAELRRIQDLYPLGVLISAQEKSGLKLLTQALEALLEE